MGIRQVAGLLASLVPLAGCPASQAGDRTSSSWEPADTAPRLPAATAAAARYYVATGGSDRNPGSAAAPFRTIQKAADVAGAGDTVLVRPGIYTGGDRIVSLRRSGAAGRPITFLSERRWGAVLDGRNGTSLVGWYFDRGVSHVRVEGFEIRDLQEHGFDFYGGGVDQILIVRNHVHHVGRNCTDTSNGRTGASLGAGARRVTFDGNVWHDIGRYAPGERGCSPRTENYQNHDHGIYVADAGEITIKNNVFYRFGRGWPVHRYSSRDALTRGLTIVNNTFAGQNPYRPGHIILASPTESLRIENNIFHGPNEAAVYFENRRFPGAWVRYNMIYGGVTKVGRPSGVTFFRNWERTDPRFKSVTDFRLQYDSPAVDAGLPLAEVPEDADAVRRPRGTGYDLGAYER